MRTVCGWYKWRNRHDEVTHWKHFPRYWPFVRGIHRSLVNSPHKGQWRGTLMFSLIWAWINGWVINGEAGDLRHHRVHYDVIVMRNHIFSNAIVKKINLALLHSIELFRFDFCVEAHPSWRPLLKPYEDICAVKEQVRWSQGYIKRKLIYILCPKCNEMETHNGLRFELWCGLFAVKSEHIYTTYWESLCSWWMLRIQAMAPIAIHCHIICHPWKTHLFPVIASRWYIGISSRWYTAHELCRWFAYCVCLWLLSIGRMC